MPTPKLGFIGAGNMAEAIARGVIRAGLYESHQLIAADPSAGRRDLFLHELNIPCVAESRQIVAAAPVLLLAVKPQVIGTALEQIRPAVAPNTLILSIVAAISTGFIEKGLASSSYPQPRVVRIMPNTPMLVGAGMSALAKGAYATDEDLLLAERIFSAGGKTVRTVEEQMNAVTALSGSGPAYVFFLTEAMAAAGPALGLSEADAALLARQTVIGAAKLLEASPDAPADLRRKVTSPGGTTQAAIEALQASDFFGVMAGALAAAQRRGQELSK